MKSSKIELSGAKKVKSNLSHKILKNTNAMSFSPSLSLEKGVVVVKRLFKNFSNIKLQTRGVAVRNFKDVGRSSKIVGTIGTKGVNALNRKFGAKKIPVTSRDFFQ